MRLLTDGVRGRFAAAILMVTAAGCATPQASYAPPAATSMSTSAPGTTGPVRNQAAQPGVLGGQVAEAGLQPGVRGRWLPLNGHGARSGRLRAALADRVIAGARGGV